uniref:Uncharacterized protein n=1 Tax=Rhizophora mucronata TaxID=61149 RepID=A0A2P2NU00_RHIMU
MKQNNFLMWYASVENR